MLVCLSMPLRNLTLRSVLIYVCTALFIAGFVVYILFQARLLLQGPQITLTQQPAIQQNSRTMQLEGLAQNIVGITLNGRPIYTDENGYFKETLILENGYTIATLRAQDRYGRATALTQTFVYTPTTTSETNL